MTGPRAPWIIPRMKILIATDGLPPATHAMHEATRLLVTQGAEILLVSVLDPELRVSNLDAEKDLQDGIALLKTHGIEARSEVLRGPYADAIVAKAEELHADVVVVGHERSGRLVQLLLGSVATEVVRRFSGAVLVVPYRSH